MKIAISGSTGFVGSLLCSEFTQRGWTIIPILRSDFARDEESFAEKISGCEIIINLAGASINKRWTKDYKKIIQISRVATTSKIVNAISSLEQKPKLFISVSAVGIYDDNGIWTETKYSYNSDFLAEVCKAWESKALKAERYCRTAVLRFGVVLHRNEGALKKLLLPFRLGLGGRIGKGIQGFSWIHSEDLVRAILFVINNVEIKNICNVVAPRYTDNSGFTKTLSAVLKRPAFMSVPAFLLRMLYGERASVMISGQKVRPEKLIRNGFVFKFPELKDALKNIFKIG